MTPRCLALLLVLLVGGRTATAQSVPALVTDRPDQTESAVVMPVGWVQIETGVLLEEGRGDHVRGGVLARIGLAAPVEVRLGLNTDVRWRNGTRADLDGASVGGKLALVEGDRPLALLGTLGLPVEGGSATGEVRLLHAFGLTPAVGLGLNVGATIDGSDIDPLYTLALGAALAARVNGFVEVYGALDPYVDAGLTWLVRPNVQFDVSAGRRVSGGENTGFVGLGVSVRVPR